MDRRRPKLGSQRDIILRRLEATPNTFVSGLELHKASGSLAVHSVIAALRDMDYQIENRMTRVESGDRSVRISDYKLIPDDGNLQPELC